VYCPLWGGDFVTFVKQARRHRFFEQVGMFLTPAGLAMDAFYALADWNQRTSEVPLGIYTAAHGYWPEHPQTARHTQWVAQFMEREGELPHVTAPPVFSGTLMVLGRAYPLYNVVYVGFVILLGLALWALLNRTRTGKVVRVAAMDRDMASAVGINVPLVYTCLVATVVLVATLLLWGTATSPFGLLLRAAREKPEWAAFVGIPVHRCRLAAFVVSAAFSGLAGALVVPFGRTATPEMLFWTKSIDLS
jgi:branched-subunit amino acid ABC-type transport system permease component